VPLKAPDNIAKDPQSWLDKIASNAPAAEVYYPALIKHDLLDGYPTLIWRQPWLSPDSIMHWPPLMDIDRTPFVAWDKRIGQ
jgi:hypothetical protein